LLTKEINPRLGAKRLGEVEKSDVHDLLDEIVDRGAPIVANRTLAALRRLCNWAIEGGIIDASPCEKIMSPAVEENGSSRASFFSTLSPTCSPAMRTPAPKRLEMERTRQP